MVALVACEAETLVDVEATAESRDLTTYSVFVKVVSLRTFHADIFVPSFASIEVCNFDDRLFR